MDINSQDLSCAIHAMSVDNSCMCCTRMKPNAPQSAVEAFPSVSGRLVHHIELYVPALLASPGKLVLSNANVDAISVLPTPAPHRHPSEHGIGNAQCPEHAHTDHETDEQT